MQLFYTSKIEGELIELTPEESHHAVKVLRKNCGDELHVIDGTGGLYRATIIEAHAKRCILKIEHSHMEYGKLPYRLRIAIAPTKNIDRTEWFMEKATEIGIDGFTPLLCSHSERKVVNNERLEKVVMSAVKQSLKAYKPTIAEMVSFRDFVSQDFGQAECFIAHCSDTFERTHLKNILNEGRDVVVMIGPEGDFSDEEITLAEHNGFKSISLGESRLRTETAALYATTIVSIHSVNGTD